MMRVGAAQVDITPPIGGELSGFAARIQPSIGVLDPLFARALYLESGRHRFLWLNLDVLGVTREFVLSVRAWAATRLGLAAPQVLISATHTHAGPPTLVLQEAGAYDPAYVALLEARACEAAERALHAAGPCEVVMAEGLCELAIDRRQKPSAHVDPKVGAAGFRRVDGSFAAVLVNYPVHAVALGPTNRRISADLPGRTAGILAGELPGRPMVLVTNGACGNLNPPYENISETQLDEWGGMIARAVLPGLRSAESIPEADLRYHSRPVHLALDAMTPTQVDAYAAHAMQISQAVGEWGEKFSRAVERWRCVMRGEGTPGAAEFREMECHAVRIGGLTFLGVNAELFSRFTDTLREKTGCSQIYTVGYANGVYGYLPTIAAFEEGGYEVETAHIFYLAQRFKAGAFESLADEALALLRELEQHADRRS